ncbi:MAG: phosphoribosylanthranilate isomerase [Solirubrobacteraceae bacterium]
MSASAPRIKLCGITRLDDARAAVEAGAWAVGVIFWPGSERHVGREEAAAIGAALRRRAEVCGVFVNATLDHVAEVADEAGLTMIQLHGDEGPAYCSEVARRTGCRVVKAVQVRSGADVRALRSFPTDYHLLDAWAPGRRGGVGAPFPWELARSHSGAAPVILSGGLRPENVAAAIAAARPWAVDVSSGVESAPGIKDRMRIAAFAEAVAATAAPVAPDAVA